MSVCCPLYLEDLIHQEFNIFCNDSHLGVIFPFLGLRATVTEQPDIPGRQNEDEKEMSSLI